jgi:hypothetical protein
VKGEGRQSVREDSRDEAHDLDEIEAGPMADRPYALFLEARARMRRAA